MLTLSRFHKITGHYPNLCVAVVGDYCLDRYFDIDPKLTETSIETGLPVHNIVRVRCQPGGAGTLVNNIAALGVGRILPIGITGIDGEGWELRRALKARSGVDIVHLLETPDRRTFTYTKPLVHELNCPPCELNRLDIKNWTPTPLHLKEALASKIRAVAKLANVILVLDQVDVPDTGVISETVLETLSSLEHTPGSLRPLILGDSRRGFRGWPAMGLKMNGAELGATTGCNVATHSDRIAAAVGLARERQNPVFVTLAEFGMLAATPEGQVTEQPALPVEGPVDVVGAGDSVTVNLATALASGASVKEAMSLGMTAANLVVQQLGTTGTASISQMEARLFSELSVDQILKIPSPKPPTG
jgi:rfaE bifunctional protein kinase chain/domain